MAAVEETLYRDGNPVYPKTITNQVVDKESGTTLPNLLNNKQNTLVSGTTIKTVNGNSLLGTGDITISSGGTISVDTELSTTSTNPVQNKAIYSSLLWQTDSTNKGIVSKTNLTTGGKATGVNSFACGDNCTALGDASHVEGIGSTASENYSHAQGKYNVTDAYADIIGGGTNANARKNIETTD